LENHLDSRTNTDQSHEKTSPPSASPQTAESAASAAVNRSTQSSGVSEKAKLALAIVGGFLLASIISLVIGYVFLWNPNNDTSNSTFSEENYTLDRLQSENPKEHTYTSIKPDDLFGNKESRPNLPDLPFGTLGDETETSDESIDEEQSNVEAENEDSQQHESETGEQTDNPTDEAIANTNQTTDRATSQRTTEPTRPTARRHVPIRTPSPSTNTTPPKPAVTSAPMPAPRTTEERLPLPPEPATESDDAEPTESLDDHPSAEPAQPEVISTLPDSIPEPQTEAERRTIRPRNEQTGTTARRATESTSHREQAPLPSDEYSQPDIYVVQFGAYKSQEAAEQRKTDLENVTNQISLMLVRRDDMFLIVTNKPYTKREAERIRDAYASLGFESFIRQP